MRTVLLVALLVAAADAKSIRLRRAISEFPNSGAPPSIVISDDSNGAAQSDINSYKSVLEGLLRQLSAIEQKTKGAGADASAELADEYQREYYTQAASEIVQKLLQYGALSAIVDAENAAFYEDTDGQMQQESANDEEDNLPLIRVNVEEIAPANNSEEEPFTDEQAHGVLKMIIEELMDKFFADLKNTHVFVLGAGSKQAEEEESGETVVASGEDASSSSSEEDSNEYYYVDSDEEYDDYTIDSDDDAVIVVNKQVSTNVIRIPTATFVDAITKLLPTFRTYPAQLTQLTPLQVEDPRVYSEHGETALTGPKPGSGPTPGSGAESVQLPVHVAAHSVSPIASVASPTAAAAVAETTRHSEMRHYVFDLGHVLVCIAAALLILWALVQLWSMYRSRNAPGGLVGPAPAMALPPKVIPTSSIIPNIYATPPAVRHTQPAAAVDAEKPPVYVENPAKPEA